MADFNRSKHIYSSPDFEEIIKDTIRFFNGTPVHTVPTPERFHGTGVYAIYSISKNGIYKNFHEINRTSFDLPIYIGKAVPKGWRQSSGWDICHPGRGWAEKCKGVAKPKKNLLASIQKFMDELMDK